MLQSLKPLIDLLSWLALPATLICIVDDWFLRPRRALSAPAGAQAAPDATWLITALHRAAGADHRRGGAPA